MNITMLVLNNLTNDPRVHKEAKTLANAGHHVTVIALWKPGLPEIGTMHNYQVIRVRLRTREWRGSVFAPMVKYIEYAIQVWRLVAKQPAHIIHANDANTLPASWLASKRVGAQLIYDAHELETGREFQTTRLSNIYRYLWACPERAFIRRARAVITVSEGIAGELERLYHIPRPLVLRNCPEIQNLYKPSRLREELSIPPHLKIALYQGSVSEGRGIRTFLEAIQLLPEVAGVVLGEGPLLPALQAQIQNGNWQRVYLPGKVPMDTIPSHLASADLGIVLTENICRSYYLSLPNKLFEYIQSGIPVIASDLPEIARIVKEYEVGELVNPQDPRAIAAGIRRLLEEPNRYAITKANARKAATILNWDVEKTNLIGLYQEIQGRGKS
jgi:glycosyltransferase involved in cell wall biosynthesis